MAANTTSPLGLNKNKQTIKKAKKSIFQILFIVGSIWGHYAPFSDTNLGRYLTKKKACTKKL